MGIVQQRKRVAAKRVLLRVRATGGIMIAGQGQSLQERAPEKCLPLSKFVPPKPAAVRDGAMDNGRMAACRPLDIPKPAHRIWYCLPPYG